MNRRNFQREMDRLTDSLTASGKRPRLLMHACCAPCSSYVMEYLSRYFDLTMYFYNPNIDSAVEYEKRAAELKRLIGEMGFGLGLVIAPYEPEAFEEIARGHETDPERGERCSLCFRLRLGKTAEYMRQMNSLLKTGKRFDYFATTLTLSRRKNALVINGIGEAVGKETGETYLCSEFKKHKGEERSIELSEKYGLYRQDYCGCRFSKRNIPEGTK